MHIKPKTEPLPKGKYFIRCLNDPKDRIYWLIDGKLAKFTCLNSKYDFAMNKTSINIFRKSGIYVAKKISKKDYKIYNI